MKAPEREALGAALRELLLAGIAGDSASYQKFLEQVSELLRGFLMGALSPSQRSVERVEDLVQEVLLSIHRKRDLYRAEHPILPWLYAIARYKLIDSLRQEKVRPRGSVAIEDLENELFVEATEFLPDDGEHLLDGLSDRQKEIIRLAKVEEEPLAQIAAKLGMSLSAVKVSIHRSLQILRKRGRL